MLALLPAWGRLLGRDCWEKEHRWSLVIAMVTRDGVGILERMSQRLQGQEPWRAEGLGLQSLQRATPRY